MTLVELLAVLSIVAILLGIGVPGMHRLVAGTRANGSMTELYAMLASARQMAVLTRREVTLCGTVDGITCSRTWNGNPTLVFVDSNRNRRADAAEDIFQVSELTHTGHIRWSASGNRNYLRFRPDGSVVEFGNFSYCPANADARSARQLILNVTGRPRAAVDADGDGIVEDRNGNPLRCN
jgi:type IV fimbrial biogenesis protein FimT